MKLILKTSFLIIAMPTILIILMKATNQIFSDTVVEYLNRFIWALDRFLGNEITNLLLILISMMLVIRVTTRVYKRITWTQDKE